MSMPAGAGERGRLGDGVLAWPGLAASTRHPTMRRPPDFYFSIPYQGTWCHWLVGLQQ